MASEDRANDRDRGEDGGDLEDKVTTFGEDLSGLSDAELERQVEAYLAEQKRQYREPAEAYLAEQERQYREPAEAYLRRQEERYKSAAEDYLGFEGSWSPEVDRGGE